METEDKVPSFSATSNQKLITCDMRLIRIFDEVIKYIDCTVLCGYRNEAEQNKAFAEGKSTKKWPESKHNTNPSKAVDVVPYPLIWPDKKLRPNTYVKDLARFYFFAGFVKAIATQKGIKIITGADWNGNMDFTDQRFDDLPHFEIAE